MGAVHETLKLLKRIFPIRSCKQGSLKKQERPCLNAFIQRCSAPCQGQITQDDYRKMVADIISFLEGKEETLVHKLEKQMKEAAERLDFEKAAELRDQLLSVEKVREKQKIVSGNFVDMDVLNYAQGAERACVQIFLCVAAR